MVTGILEKTFDEKRACGEKLTIRIELMEIATADIEGNHLRIAVNPYSIIVHYKERDVIFDVREMAQEAVEMIDKVNPK
jgi:hypothetical protein